MTDKLSCNRAEMRVCAEGFLAKPENLQICTKLQEQVRLTRALARLARLPARQSVQEHGLSWYNT